MQKAAILAGTFLASISAWPVAAQSGEPDKIKILYQFNNEGNMPYAGIVFAKDAIYGTTAYGGSDKCEGGCGNVFSLTPAHDGIWQQQTLYAFKNGADGESPAAPVTVDKYGNVYGYTGTTTPGSVFQLTPPAQPGGAYSYTLIFTFPDGRDGNLYDVGAELILKSGRLYGVASGGSKACGQGGCGLFFRLDPPAHGQTGWTKKVLYRFTGTGHDGQPNGIAGFDSAGGLYVALAYGGGSIVRLAPPGGLGPWTEQVVADFRNQQGSYTVSNLVLAPNDTLYATDAHRVLAFTRPQPGTKWTRTKLADVSVRGYPPSSLALGPDGSLIGVIYGDQDLYFGDAFQLTPPASGTGDWIFTELWNFNRGPDQNPNNIVQGRKDRLLGVLSGGTYSNGTVFALKPRG